MDFWIVLIYAAYLCLVRHLAIEEIYLRSLHLFLVWCGITFMLGVFKATEWLDLGLRLFKPVISFAGICFLIAGLSLSGGVYEWHARTVFCGLFILLIGHEFRYVTVKVKVPHDDRESDASIQGGYPSDLGPPLAPVPSRLHGGPPERRASAHANPEEG